MDLGWKGTLTLTLKTETRTISEGTFHQQSRTASALQHWNYPFGSPCPCISSRNSLMCLSGFLWSRLDSSAALSSTASSGFSIEELSAAEASSQTQKTFVLTLSELFQEILYAYDTKPIGWFLLIKSDMYRILALLAQYQLFFIRNPSALVKRKIWSV